MFIEFNPPLVAKTITVNTSYIIAITPEKTSSDKPALRLDFAFPVNNTNDAKYLYLHFEEEEKKDIKYRRLKGLIGTEAL